MQTGADNEYYIKWRISLFRINFIIALAVFLLELGIFIVLFVQDHIDQPLYEYIPRFLVVPSVLNFLAVGVEFFIMKKYPHKVNLQNEMVLYIQTAICIVSAATHYVFASTLTVFCIPILSSVVFCSRKLTQNTWFLSVAGIFIAMANRFANRYPNEDKYFIPDFCLSMAIVFLSLLIARIIIDLISEQNKQLIDLAIESNEAKRQALEANKAKSKFLANMSHEIRTPINGILGMDSIILRESTDEEIREYAANIQSAGKSLLSIINDILDFSKIESGKMEIVPVEYELFSLINDCYNMLIMRAREGNLDLRVENDPNMPAHFVGDEIRIRQIVTNLLTNAVKYTQKGYVILKVNGRESEDGKYILIVSVIDTGVGISKENQQKLFQSYERVNEVQNRGIEGTGLGLIISKQLVDQMNGKIVVKSEPGKGSEFTVEIPQTVRHVGKVGNFYERYHHIDSSAPYREKFHAPNACILVVDDVQMNLKVFQGLLKRTQMRVDTADSGEKCLEMVKEKRYDIIFLDHMMPDMDGIETFRRMKQIQNSPNSNTPVIMLTANAMSSAKKEYFKIGFTDYLSKPIHETALENLIERYLSPDLVISDFKKNSDLAIVQPSSDSSEILEKLKDVLDTVSGMKYCMNDANFYVEIIRDFINSERIDKIDNSLKAKNFEDYRVNVHALKSTSLSIGANSLSETAKQLEVAAINSDTEYIEANHEQMISEYKELLDKLKQAFAVSKEV